MKLLLLKNEMLDGREPVVIKNHKLPEYGKDREGRAVIMEVLQGDRQGVEANVAWIDPPYGRSRVWVFASDQPDGEELVLCQE